jgi:hypothetical protein
LAEYKSQHEKREVQSLRGKINYLRRFISNLAGKIESFLLSVRLKHEKGFIWGGRTEGSVRKNKKLPEQAAYVESTMSRRSIQIVRGSSREGHRRRTDTRRLGERVCGCIPELVAA